MAKLKPWYQVVTPREDLRENRPLDASEFAVHLDHIRDNRAPSRITSKPERFFERTYMTRSLLDLSSQVVRRLSGIKVETSAVFNMATQFGGGKTHSLTALYHLAQGGQNAQNIGAASDRSSAGPRSRPSPRPPSRSSLAPEFDIIDGPRRRRRAASARRPGERSPGSSAATNPSPPSPSTTSRASHPPGDVIRKMLPKEPSLILMDELHQLRQQRPDKPALATAALRLPPEPLRRQPEAQDHVVLCVSIPASELEMTPRGQRD